MFKDATDAVFNVIGIAVDTGIAAVDSVSISNGEVIDELKDAAGDGDADDIDLDDLENSVQSSSQSNGNAAGTPTNTKPETADDMEDKLKNLEKF